jgi:uncharacterized protein (DUF433 family)
LAEEIKDHEVVTVPEAGWAGIKNGELLRLAQAQFDVFITVDQNLSFQQHMPLIIEQKDLDHLPITVDPKIVSGTPVFQGTRVPVDALINNLEAGLSLDQFLDNFPTVTREQALQVLEFSKSTLLKLRKTA